MRAFKRLISVVAVVAGTLALPASAQAAPGPRLDLKVLLISSGAGDYQRAAWTTTLDALGVPYDVFVESDSNPITTEALQVDATHGKYNGIVVTDGTIMSNWGGRPAAQQVIGDYEARFGVREIADAAGPASGFGLDASWQEGSPTDLGVTATLTSAGQAIFPYLNPTVTIPYESGLYMYLAAPASSALLQQWNGWGITDVTSFQTLVQGPTVTGSAVTAPAAIVGIATHADGRQQLVTTVNSSDWSTSDKLLHVGMLDWVTRGLYLGNWRNYFSMHFDDVLLADSRWSSPTLVEPAQASTIRMTAADVARAVAWTQSTGVRLDLVFNGQGASPDNGGKGVKKGQNDPLTTALLASKSAFGWISHTWSHADFDSIDTAAMVNEINKNITWAGANKLTFDPTELVTGGHTGLTNLPAFTTALSKTGVKTVAADASLQQWKNVQPLGPATVVPRHPTWLAYDAGTRAEQVDEFFSQNTWTGLAATWDNYVDVAVSDILTSVLRNDPRPFYAHQSNLAEDGNFLPVANAMLAKFHAWYSVPLSQPTMSQAAALLNQQASWTAAVAAGAVTGYVQDGVVHLQSTRTVTVPVNGTTVGTAYDGVVNSGWVTVTPTGAVTLATA